MLYGDNLIIKTEKNGFLFLGRFIEKRIGLFSLDEAEEYGAEYSSNMVFRYSCEGSLGGGLYTDIEIICRYDIEDTNLHLEVSLDRIHSYATVSYSNSDIFHPNEHIVRTLSSINKERIEGLVLGLFGKHVKIV